MLGCRTANLHEVGKMQRLCSVLALCLLLPLVAWARLDVSGTISEDQIWSPTDSVVVINGVCERERRRDTYH